MEANSLAHYGILGMKWGVRRTPAQLARARGSTPSEKKDEKKTGSKQSSSSSSSSKEKSVSQMSNEELRSKVDRLQLERQALSLEREISAMSPKQVSKGRQFVSSLLNEVVIPSAKTIAKSTLTDFMDKKVKEALGIKGDSDPLKALEREFKTKNYQKQISELNKYFEAEKAKGSTSGSRESQTTTTTTTSSDKDSGPNQKETSGSSNANSKEKSGSSAYVFEGTVVGEGTSRRNSGGSTRTFDESEVIDVDFVDISPSNVTSETRSLGRSYIDTLLALGDGKDRED